MSQLHTLQGWKSRNLPNTVFDNFLNNFRVNGLFLQILNSNSSSPSNNTLQSDEVTNVQDGVISDDICRLSEPCENNGTCQNVGFDDFR